MDAAGLPPKDGIVWIPFCHPAPVLPPWQLPPVWQFPVWQFPPLRQSVPFWQFPPVRQSPQLKSPQNPWPPLWPKFPESIPELNIEPELLPGTQVVNIAAWDVIAGAAATINTVRAAAESKRNFIMVNPPICFKIITFLLQNYNNTIKLEDIPVNSAIYYFYLLYDSAPISPDPTGSPGFRQE